MTLRSGRGLNSRPLPLGYESDALTTRLLRGPRLLWYVCADIAQKRRKMTHQTIPTSNFPLGYSPAFLLRIEDLA